MKHVFLSLLVLTLAAAPSAALAEEEMDFAAADVFQKRIYAVVFDFACHQGDYGKQISDSIRLRLRGHKEYFVVDRLTTQEIAGPTGAEADQNKVVKIIPEQQAVTTGLYGTVTKTGDGTLLINNHPSGVGHSQL